MKICIPDRPDAKDSIKAIQTLFTKHQFLTTEDIILKDWTDQLLQSIKSREGMLITAPSVIFARYGLWGKLGYLEYFFSCTVAAPLHVEINHTLPFIPKNALQTSCLVVDGGGDGLGMVSLVDFTPQARVRHAVTTTNWAAGACAVICQGLWLEVV